MTLYEYGIPYIVEVPGKGRAGKVLLTLIRVGRKTTTYLRAP
jgi:hypothetical protein